MSSIRFFSGRAGFYHAVSPEIFDKVTRENGLPTRTFNFGIDGMNPPENFYVLDQILKTEPRNLKWVFVEVGDIETKSHANILSTQRVLYWHDWPRTALTLRKAFNPRGTAKWYQKLNRLWSARRTFILHLGFSKSSSLTSGARPISCPRKRMFPLSNRIRTLGRWRRLSARGSGDVSGAGREIPAQTRRGGCERRGPNSLIRTRKVRIAIAQQRFGGSARPRSSWSRRASINHQRSSENRLRPARCSCFNDSKTYPQLYDIKVRVDDQHLTNEGAAEIHAPARARICPFHPPTLTSHAFR